MKHQKRIISLLLAFILIMNIVGVMPASISAAEEDTVPSGKNDTVVTIYGIDGEVDEVKEFNVGDTFTVYVTLDCSKIKGGYIGSLKAEQRFTNSILSEIDEKNVKASGTTFKYVDQVFPVTRGNTVANAGLEDRIVYNASTPDFDEDGFAFNTPDSLLIVTNYKVIAPGEASITNHITTLASSDFTLTKIIDKGEIKNPDFTLHGSFTSPSAEPSSTSVSPMYHNSKKIEGLSISFDSDWFFKDSKTYNHSIAQLCSQMIYEGYQSKKDKNELHLDKWDLELSLNELGFRTEDDKVFKFKKGQGRDKEDYFITSKNIIDGGKSYNLVFVGCIGSNGEQWNSNFDPSGFKGEVYYEDSNYWDNHCGFDDAKSFVFSGLKDYLDKNGYTKENTKLLLTGHSRGAAAANLMAAKIIDEKLLVTPENLFTYTFATPNCTKNVNPKSGKSDSKYSRIFNIVNPTDFVTMVMPNKWGYGRYGTTYVLPSQNNDTRYKKSLKKKMIKYYSLLNDAKHGNTVYHEYKNGEEEVYSLIKTMTKYIKEQYDYYSKEFLAGRIHMTPFRFFQEGLCPIVNNSSLNKMADAICLILDAKNPNIAAEVCGYFTGMGSGDLFYNVSSFFYEQEFFSRFKLELLYTQQGAFDNLDIKLKFLDSGRFGDAHKPETYCAFMMGLSSKEVRFGNDGKIRKPTKGTVNCPVDIEVIDKDTNEIVGRIVNNTVDEEIAEKENSIVMTVDGDEKTYWLPSDGNYEVHLIGNDDGVMDYTLSEVDSDIGETARMNYYDVEIVKGEEYICAVSKDISEDEPDIYAYTLTDEAGNEIAPDESFTSEEEVEYSVDVNIEGSGSADSFTVTNGDYATLTAAPFRSDFIGWYQGDTLISDEEEYRFRPTEDITLTAKFTEAEPMLLGDVDIDDIISVVDATYILRSKAEITTLIDDAFLMNGDVDGSGELEVIDATYIQSWLAEMNVPYGIGEKIAA